MKNNLIVNCFLISLLTSISIYSIESSDNKNSKPGSEQKLEFQAVQFLEKYPYELQGIGSGGRLYWTFMEGGAGIFFGAEEVGLIPTRPGFLDGAKRELDNRFRYTGQITNPIYPTGVQLPPVANFDTSLSLLTLSQFGKDASSFSSQKLNRTYLGFQFFPKEFRVSKSFYFVLGLDFLVGYQKGNLEFNGIQAKFNSIFGAIEPNLRFRYALSENTELSFLLPIRFIWLSPVEFQKENGSMRYSTDLQRGIAIGISIRF